MDGGQCKHLQHEGSSARRKTIKLLRKLLWMTAPERKGSFVSQRMACPFDFFLFRLDTSSLLSGGTREG